MSDELKPIAKRIADIIEPITDKAILEDSYSMVVDVVIQILRELNTRPADSSCDDENLGESIRDLMLDDGCTEMPSDNAMRKIIALVDKARGYVKPDHYAHDPQLLKYDIRKVQLKLTIQEVSDD